MNYLFCVNKNPGTPASDMYKKTIQLYKPDRYEVVSSDVMDVVDDGLSWRICIKSNVLKPPRTHYCQSIHACVMNYDHYCPWAFNAIGFGNLRFFMLFLIYLSVGCFYTSYMTFRPFYDVLFKPRHEREYLEYEIPAFLFLITGLVGPAVLFLAALNLKSIFYGMTAIDELCYFHRLQIYQGYGLSKEQAAKEANPYDRGWKKNWLSMTGSYSLISSFLFPFFSEPQLPPWPSDLNSKMRILVTKNDSRHFSANNIDTSMLLGRRTAAKQQQQHFSNANPESSNREIPIKTSIFEGEKLHMV